jgi:hypothetical protein
VRSLLQGIRDGAILPPVCAFRCADGVVRLTHGMHRWRVSQALGFRTIPCRLLTPDEAAQYGLA